MGVQQGIWILAPAALFLVSVVLFVTWRRGKLRRWPFDHDTRILRLPGESTRVRMEAIAEDALLAFLGGFAIATLTPFGVLLLFASGSALFRPEWFHFQLWVRGLGTVLGVVAAGWWVSRRIVDYWKLHLGYLGERFTGDRLDQLDRRYWRVFHDLDCAYGNIDHVAVGPGGVVVVETKTWRKWRTFKNGHCVLFDGCNLTLPTCGVQNAPLVQAERNAEWLAREIWDRTGLKVRVRPLVTLPGWYVDDVHDPDVSPPRREARVVATKAIANFIAGGKPQLGDGQVQTIAQFLDARCRDVKL